MDNSCYECRYCELTLFFLRRFSCEHQDNNRMLSFLPVELTCNNFQRATGCSCGVGKFKLGKNHPFEAACQWHDKEYETWLCKPTKPMDKGFKLWCLKIATMRESKELYKLARRCYKLTRIWGTMRYYYAKIRGWKYLIKKN